MAKQRGPDGVPIDVPTTVNKEAGSVPSPHSPAAPDVPTEPMSPEIPPRPASGGSLFLDDPPTAPPKRVSPSSTEPTIERTQEPVGDPATQIAGGRKSGNKPVVGALAQSQAPAQEGMANPVVGWLVVIDGPGKGNFLKLGFGQNSIGRASTERVCIDFGDSEISRANHATVTYDPRGNRFYIQQGSGTNLAYLNDSPILSPTVLEPSSEVSLGQTKLRFAAFCDDQFTWDEE